MAELQFFDREQERSIVWKRLPHWSQAGTLCFITWRTADSLPKDAISRLADERRRLFDGRGLNVRGDWRREMTKLHPADRGRLHWLLFSDWDRELDQSAGACVLRNPDLSRIVFDSLMHFDGDRCDVTDFVVMPNHVHFLAAFQSEEGLIKQCENWKRFSAREINKRLGIHGDFWQGEQFDHLVRSDDDFRKYRQYIAENPLKAGLKAGKCAHFTKKLS
ncbi:MAG TPA: transposase [Lacipirellulaceae bacterium]|jgi:type I restriction enzyme R subunit|nr:transposase [Lacipirellulaceae bacterium]